MAKSKSNETLDAIRKEIEQKQAELDLIDKQPIAQEAAFERVDQYLENASEAIKERYFKQMPFLNIATRAFEIRGHLDRLEPLELQIWLHADTVREKLREAVVEHFAAHKTAGLTDMQRIAKTNEIETALVALQRQEEQVFLELKGAGLEPARRGSEDPNLIYGVVGAQ